MAKVTLATIKSFIRKNQENLLIKTKSHFDGMYDCVMPCGNNDFTPVQAPEHNHENTLGIHGAWVVFGGRDYFTPFEKDGLRGYDVSNCCGSFSLAVKV